LIDDIISGPPDCRSLWRQFSCFLLQRIAENPSILLGKIFSLQTDDLPETMNIKNCDELTSVFYISKMFEPISIFASLKSTFSCGIEGTNSTFTEQLVRHEIYTVWLEFQMVKINIAYG
jgi:hypothetical protein